MPSRLSSHRNRVLCVERESDVSDALKLALEAAGASVDCVMSGTSAFEIISSHPRQYDAIITEHEGADRAGITLVAGIREAGYKGRIFIFSTLVTSHDRDAYSLFAIDGIFDKPEAFRALVDAIETMPVRAPRTSKARMSTLVAPRTIGRLRPAPQRHTGTSVARALCPSAIP